MEKSSRHSKITGDFGEYLVLYWLSKRGFECARLDHTGIDLIAADPHSGERLGISVKSRSRFPGKENESINISDSDIEKAEEACKPFDCRPYFAIVSDTHDSTMFFLLPVKRLRELLSGGKETRQWKMTEKDIQEYQADPNIEMVSMRTTADRWWKNKVIPKREPLKILPS